MNKLQAGFSKLNINPPMGTPINGYFHTRYVKGIRDDLEVCALALRAEDTTVVLLSADNCLIFTPTALSMRQQVAQATGLPVDAVWLHTTHTHLAPQVSDSNLSGVDHLPEQEKLVAEYEQFLRRQLTDAAVLAIADLKDAKMGWAVGKAPNISFVRRFRMKDGTVRTNPGIGNPDILHPIGEVDERVNVLRFDRADDSLVLVNFGCHPDVIGGELISADWPGFTRRRVEKALDNVKCIFFTGTQGDLNHVNVNDPSSHLPDIANTGVRYPQARHMGNVVAGAVLQVYEKVHYEDVDSLRFLSKTAAIPSNIPNPEDLPLAREYCRLHKEGRDDLIPFAGMEKTTVIAEAARMLRLEHGPEFFNLGMNAIALGNIGFVSIPGEPFNGVGLGLKEAEGWTLVLPMAVTNGYDGYFPMQDAYDEGGYEARSSNYRAGVAEQIIEEGLQLLKELR
ncbi:MAG: AroM family protein [Ruminococcaceae bacterium]|nr:AroM family protein [Oscillospiraceae bacterium]